MLHSAVIINSKTRICTHMRAFVCQNICPEHMFWHTNNTGISEWKYTNIETQSIGYDAARLPQGDSVSIPIRQQHMRSFYSFNVSAD
jgi:hypothetical protein